MHYNFEIVSAGYDFVDDNSIRVQFAMELPDKQLFVQYRTLILRQGDQIEERVREAMVSILKTVVIDMEGPCVVHKLPPFE